jgi:hypothetical protein
VFVVVVVVVVKQQCSLTAIPKTFKNQKMTINMQKIRVEIACSRTSDRQPGRRKLKSLPHHKSAGPIYHHAFEAPA